MALSRPPSLAGGPAGLRSVMEVLGVNETAILFEMRSPLYQLFSVCTAGLSLVRRGASEAIFILKGHLYRNKHPLQNVLFV